MPKGVYPRKRKPREERFWPKVNKTESCWLWTGAHNGIGYGVFGTARDEGRGHTYAHRLSYELLRGPIPEGMQLDHLCRTPSCVNPDHLEAVMPRTNYLRGKSPTALNAMKSACKRGHPFTLKKNGKRTCQPCDNEDRQIRLRARHPERFEVCPNCQQLAPKKPNLRHLHKCLVIR